MLNGYWNVAVSNPGSEPRKVDKSAKFKREMYIQILTSSPDA